MGARAAIGYIMIVCLLTDAALVIAAVES